MQTERFTYLFHQYITLKTSEEEANEFIALASQPAYHPLLEELSRQYEVPENQAPVLQDEAAGQILQSILENREKSRTAPVHPLRRWVWAAASVLLILGLGIWFYTHSGRTAQPLAGAGKGPAVEIKPGRDGAVLTLADGWDIVLDSLKNGVIASQRGTQIVLNDGKLSYDAREAGAVSYNTIRTPRGRQYQLVLPDGSRVWLNAESSIRFPTVFRGAERTVTITGEVCFDIVKNQEQPFQVHAGKTLIEVLGTSFNVMAYPDEEEQRTALVSGSVRVRSDGQQVLLKPGSVARIRETITVSQAGAEQEIAWKNGVFSFDHADLRSVMRQLARWYDIDVEIPGSLLRTEFGGSIGRDLALPKVLKMLEGYGLHYSISNRKLIISQ